MSKAWRVAWLDDGHLIREDFHTHALATGRLAFLRDVLKRATYPEPYRICGYEWSDQ